MILKTHMRRSALDGVLPGLPPRRAIRGEPIVTRCGKNTLGLAVLTDDDIRMGKLPTCKICRSQYGKIYQK